MDSLELDRSLGYVFMLVNPWIMELSIMLSLPHNVCDSHFSRHYRAIADLTFAKGVELLQESYISHKSFCYDNYY